MGCWAIFTTLSVAQTNQFLEAPVIRGELPIQLDRTGKGLEWLSESKEKRFPRGLPADKLFLTRESIRITYPKFNPLKLGATAAITAAPDPSQAVMAQLLQALASVGTSVFPAGAVVAGAVNQTATEKSRGLTSNKAAKKVIDAAKSDENPCLVTLNWLTDNILGKSQPDLAALAKAWPDLIDAGFAQKLSGPGAVSAALTGIAKDLSDLQKNTIDQAQKKLKDLNDCAITWTDKAAVYSFSTAVEQQIAKYTAFIAKAKDLSKGLHDYTKSVNWTGPGDVDYFIGDELIPTMQTMQRVDVKIATITIDATGGVLSTKSENVAGVNFSVRKFARLTPELGAGAVIGTVKQPTYATGTDKDTGKTVVAGPTTSAVSVNPVVMVNFVCRCETGWLTPMIQIGAAASKTTPAILTGMGIRLFGVGTKGNVAIGGGAMYAWVKDLQKLKVGSVITGQNDINADVGFRSTPRIGAYMSLQYNF